VEPGRELDALIAEKVMGWTLKENPKAFYDFEVFSWEGGNVDVCDFRPSTSISDAWQVVDKLKDYMCELEFDFGYENRIWAMFTVAGIIDELHPSFQSEGRSAAHAICLAALLYVGHKV
jgi:hypothetical protein